MFLPVFQDLIRPQWRAVLEELKLSGGLPVSELARRVDASYMAVKQHCEELKKLGYLDRSRIPRTAVGRPEIFYSLGAKSDALFPQAGGPFTLDLLQDLKALFGENTPDKLFFQHFQKQYEKWQPLVSTEPTHCGEGGTVGDSSKQGGLFRQERRVAGRRSVHRGIPQSDAAHF